MDPEELIREQVEYYRRRAPEYDATSSRGDDPLGLFPEEITAALQRFDPSGDVLEIASGTGSWTRLLLERATSVTALDSSTEMHLEAKRKLGDDPRVRHVEADIFTWVPDRLYDVVFFASWLSHVPPALFDRFWERVRDALKPGGRVFLVDELEDALLCDELREDFVDDEQPVVRRPLLDGTTFSVVKVLWDPDELRVRLEELGWDSQVDRSGPFFWATATRRS